MTGFEFRPARPQHWAGRYKSIPGTDTAFHIRLHDGTWWPVVECKDDGVTAECPMAHSPEAFRLAEAINAGKRYLGGNDGGSFVINEYGLLLVPDANVGGSHVALVGQCSGPLELRDTLAGYGTLEFGVAARFDHGDPWDLPYIGIPHNLSKFNEIYFWKEDSAGGKKQLPPEQDSKLIRALRLLRPSGPIRFIATYGGSIVTKIPIGVWPAMIWEPRFVYQIDFDKWFSRMS